MTDNNILEIPVTTNIDDAIDKAKKDLQTKMIAFDKWLKKITSGDPRSDPLFRQQRHEIKMARLHLNELLQMKNDYHTFRTHYDESVLTRYPEGPFTKPRNNQLGSERKNTVAIKNHLKLSRG